MTNTPDNDSETGDTPPETLFVIEGTLSHLTGKRGTRNLLKELQANSTSQNVAAGVVGAIAGASNLVANAAILEMYEGELVDNFAGKIDDHIIVGQLSGMHLINNGDHLKAVVSVRRIPKKGEVLWVHALLRPKDELLWLPGESDRGRNVVFKSQMKVVLGGGMATLVVIAIILAGNFDMEKIHLIFFSYFFTVLIFFIVALWVYRDLKPMALHAERIFTALGFPDVRNLDMRGISYASHHRTHEESELNTYFYLAVLDAHRTGQKVKINVPSVGDERDRLLAEAKQRMEQECQQTEAEQAAKDAAKQQRAEERQRRKSEKATPKPRPQSPTQEK